jgi:hypothetical protein
MAKNFKTPLKASQEPTDEEVADMVNRVETTELYKRKITTKADLERLGDVNNSFLTGIIHGIEEKLEAVSRKPVIWEAVSDQVTKKIRLELPILFTKTGSLEAMIGKRIKNELPGTEAPTVWGSIASLSTMLYENQTRLEDSIVSSAAMKDQIKEENDEHRCIFNDEDGLDTRNVRVCRD